MNNLSFTKSNNLNSSFSMLPLANPLLKHKVYQNILNERANLSTQPSQFSMSSKIKTRKLKPIMNVEPELAAKVVKSYLLPMFECRTRSTLKKHLYGKSLDMSRSHADILDSRETSAETSVYAELKLSEKLMSEIEKLKIELEDSTRKMKDSEQAKITSESELCVLKSKYEDLETNFELLKFQFDQNVKLSQKFELKIFFLNEQIDQYKALLTNSESKLEESLAECLNERMANDRLKAELQKITHFNDLIEMQNQIMGDRLKGLQTCIEDLLKIKNTEEITTKEYTSFAECCKKLAELEVELIAKLKVLTDENQTLSKDLQEMTEIKDYMKNDRDKFINRFKEKIQQIKDEMIKEKNEKEKLQFKYEDVKNNYDALTDQFDRMRDKISTFKVNRNGDIEEKVCKNCKKFFLESENFNWSCQTHSSQYSGQMWWCCGRKGELAKGCRTSKHIAKNDEEEILREERRLRKQQFCTSCSESGHDEKSCPYDPNAKTDFDIEEENERLENIRIKKKQGKSLDSDVSQKLMNILTAKDLPLSFVTETLSSEREELSSSAEDSTELNPQSKEKPTFFRDLMHIKKFLGFRSQPTIETEETQEVKRSLKRNLSKTRGDFTVLMRDSPKRRRTANFTIVESNME
ncbi:unnamed protein product [Blepharisma stoltei]|uniref:CCHC-type domain-containing protein n=1 Tax=Blepharisma stoltei TaxID=1481888 RepID=A0AAU9K9M6_9CILI|nr:unnamed protein product [Blepharisma stoltei]